MGIDRERKRRPEPEPSPLLLVVATTLCYVIGGIVCAPGLVVMVFTAGRLIAYVIGD